MNEFYYNFLDTNSIVSVTDPTGRILYVNDKFCSIAMYSRKELIGQSHKIINSGHHPKEFFEHMWKTIKSGQTWRGEVCNRAKDGSLYWVENFIKPELDDKGNIIKFYSFRIVITERKNKEEEQFYLTISKLGAIFENSPGFQFFIDKESKLISFNTAGSKIPKITRGSTVCSCSDTDSLNFEEIFIDFETHYTKAKKGEEIKVEQPIDFFNTGKKQWFLVTYFPVNDTNGIPIGVSITAVDIHQRKKAQLALISANDQKNALIESIPDPIIFKDGKGKWLIINKTAHVLFQMDGYKWQGKTDQQMITERPELKQLYTSFNKSDEFTWDTGDITETIEFANINDTTAEFSIKKHPLYHEDGRRKALVIIGQNITEWKVNQEILKKQNKKLSQIAWLQAHKARAPVARILGLSSIINLSNINDPMNKNVLDLMVDCANELDDVIHKILDYTEEDNLN